MNIEPIERAFAALGARFTIQDWPSTAVSAYSRSIDLKQHYALDIDNDARGQRFLLKVRPHARNDLDVQVLQKVKSERHLLLLVKHGDGNPVQSKDRFLCGFDEREWFVAATPGSVSTVSAARESLKPSFIRQREIVIGVRKQHRFDRRNPGSIRQGEWFFLPERNFEVPSVLIRRHEPISRGGGSKPHYVEELYRTGGEIIYVNSAYPQGISALEFNRLVSRRRVRREDFTERLRDAGVYARGKVTHPDHRAILLHEWHRVFMNTENETAAREFLAFID